MNAPTIFWQKFFDKFPEIETLEVSKWKEVHIIGYFCKLYKRLYNIDYTFKFNGPPTKSYEIFQLKKVISMLSSDPLILKDYIDWVFKTKVSERKRKITVIGFLANVDMIADFKFKYLAGKNVPISQISRSTQVSDIITQISKQHNLNVNTYGDLAFIKGMLESDLDAETFAKYNLFFSSLQDSGFNPEDLNNIK